MLKVSVSCSCSTITTIYVIHIIAVHLASRGFNNFKIKIMEDTSKMQAEHLTFVKMIFK